MEPRAVRQAFSPERCRAWADGVLVARDAWTDAWGGEQASLGRAFYTDLEQDRSRTYFDDAAASDVRVETRPGLQAEMRALLARLLETRVEPRRGWCGPGVHVFPPGGPVARRGGVVHFDTEGLSRHHRATRAPAVTLVLMLQAPETGGDLDVWDARYEGEDHPTAAMLASPKRVLRYAVGDALLLDSYQLHRIRRFRGARARITATVHAARLDHATWDSWF